MRYARFVQTSLLILYVSAYTAVIVTRSEERFRYLSSFRYSLHLSFLDYFLFLKLKTKLKNDDFGTIDSNRVAVIEKVKDILETDVMGQGKTA